MKKQKLDEIVKRLANNFSPEKIILFGSRARGAGTAESDYDLLIVEKSNLPCYKRAAKYRRALKRNWRCKRYCCLDTRGDHGVAECAERLHYNSYE